jgi:hypothetical protein
MKLFAFTVATATVLALACPETPLVRAQGYDSGAVGRPLQLDGGPSIGSDNRGQSSGGRSQDTEQSAGVRSEKNQTGTEKTGETATPGRSQTSTGLSSQRKHPVAVNLRGHRVVAFNGPRHRFAIHRRGYHLIAFNGPRHRFMIHRRSHRVVAFNEPSI